MSGENNSKILLVGATGLIGSAVVAGMAARNRPLEVLTRKTDPAEWLDRVAALNPDILISALGTTWRKAGSEAAFRAVDQDLVLSVAKSAREAGTRQMIAVSSVGADADSRNFYLRVKGEVEKSLQDMGFDRLDILRPGLLRGERGGERRFGERLAILASPLTDAFLHGKLWRYRSVAAADVAQAAIALAGQAGQGRFIHHNDDIVALAR